MTYLQELWALKRSVAAGRHDNGICAAVAAAPSSGDFRTWPEYSGWALYPVSTSDERTPHRQFWDTSSYWTGEYGSARMRLLNHLIRCEEARNAQQAS